MKSIPPAKTSEGGSYGIAWQSQGWTEYSVENIVETAGTYLAPLSGGSVRTKEGVGTLPLTYCK